MSLSCVSLLICLQNPDERVLLLTHSNAALNQLFEKLSQLDFEPTRLVRMGHGEKDLQLVGDYSANGRVDELLRLRLAALQQVGQLAASMGMSTDAAYSCERCVCLCSIFVFFASDSDAVHESFGSRKFNLAGRCLRVKLARTRRSLAGRRVIFPLQPFLLLPRDRCVSPPSLFFVILHSSARLLRHGLCA